MQIKASLHFSGQFDPKSECVFWVSFLSCDGKKGNSSKEERFVIYKCLDVAARWGKGTRSFFTGGCWKSNRTAVEGRMHVHSFLTRPSVRVRNHRQTLAAIRFLYFMSFVRFQQAEGESKTGGGQTQAGRLRQCEPNHLVSSRVKTRQRSKQAGSTNVAKYRISGFTTGQAHART